MTIKALVVWSVVYFYISLVGNELNETDYLRQTIRYLRI